MSDVVVKLKIKKVTVFEDRADVVRVGELELPPGPCVVVVPELPAVLSDEHVVARVEGLTGAMHVDDQRIDRMIVGGDDVLASRRESIAKELEAVDDQIAAARDAYDRANLERAQAELALRRYAEALVRAAGRGEGSADAWRASTDALSKALASADGKRAAARTALADLDKKRRRMVLDATPRPTGQRTVASLRLRVSAGAGGKAKLVVSTLLPCAAWRPTHEAALAQGEGDAPATVSFATCAAVWNRTGEAWDAVELVLSTARPSAGAQLPPLRADRLTLRQKTAEERKTIVVEHRDESVPKSALEGTAPGVDDGGEARVFRVDSASVADDGRPQRVELAQFTAPCALARVAFPDLVAQVFLRASLKNAGGAPILAGPVMLSMNGAYVGTGDVLYVGAGESFDVSFGSDDRFTVKNVRRRVEDKKVVGKDVVHFLRDATLAQTGATPEKVLVHLRMPVSEVKQLKVLPSPQHSTVETSADEHGILRVPVDLAANSEKKLTVAFSFDTSGDVRIPDPW